MNTLVVLVASLCVVSSVYGANYNEACTGAGVTCEEPNTECASGGDMDGKCTCVANYVRDTVANACKVKQGQACTEPTDCVTYAECSTTCNCKPGSKADGDFCVQVYDAVCSVANAAADCTNPLPHSECTDLKCKCIAGYKIGTDSPKTCMAIIGGSCTADSDCTAFANLVCTTSKCACKPGYEGAEGDTSCTKILGTKICSNDNTVCTDALVRTMCSSAGKCECDDKSVAQNDVCKVRIEENCNAATDCPNDAECTGDKCVCKSGYIKDNYICKDENSSTTATASVLVIFAAVFATFFR